MTFTLFRGTCRVKVSFYFFALLCGMAFFDRSGILLWGMLAALLHECGHIAAMRLLPGHAPKEIRVTPFGIRIESDPLSEFARGNCLILAAGSGVNFLSAAAASGFLPEFAAVSLVLGVLNILPVEGMDGGGLIRALLESRLPRKAAGMAASLLSWVTLAGMLLLGIWLLLATGHNGTWLGAALMLALSGLKKRPSP